MGPAHADFNSPTDFTEHLVPPKLAADAAYTETVVNLRGELRAVQAELAEARSAAAAADRSNRARMEFVARLSHDIRTPLQAIAGYADLLAAGIRGPLTPEQQQDVMHIQRSERHLLSLADTILDYAKLEVGAFRFSLADIPVAPLLASAHALVAPQLAARELTLEVVAASRLLVAHADADCVRRILVNLLTNAAKFTPPHGRIVLSAGADGAGVAIRVTDFGAGIPAALLPAIFEPYVQLTSSAPGATGLGLAIARDLALGMGGDVTVTSTVDMGSSFVLHLPPGERPPIRRSDD